MHYGCTVRWKPWPGSGEGGVGGAFAGGDDDQPAGRQVNRSKKSVGFEGFRNVRRAPSLSAMKPRAFAQLALRNPHAKPTRVVR